MPNLTTIPNAAAALHAERNRLARWAGALYLAYIAGLIAYFLMQGRQIVWSDAAATVRNIEHSLWFFRFTFFTQILATLLFFLAAWTLSALFKSVGPNLSLMLVLLNLAGVITECACAILRYGALACLGGNGPLRGFDADQTRALAMLLLRIGGEGMNVATLFYGAWLVPLGILVYRSRYIPRFWGVLLLADAASLCICFTQLVLFPGFQKWTYPLYPIMFIAEAGTSLWLVIKGVREAAPAISSPA